MKAGIYARVSTTDQTCTLQISELRRYADAMGWQVVEVHQDTMSGAKAARPGILAILKSVRTRRIDVVLVWKLDRFGRSVKDLLANIETLKAYRVRFIATTQGIDTDHASATGQFTLTILAAVAELERQMIMERTALGRNDALRRGVKFGRPLKVFARARALELHRAGMSERKIAAELGVKRGVVQLAIKSAKENARIGTENRVS